MLVRKKMKEEKENGLTDHIDCRKQAGSLLKASARC
jgi:hypothetical protein